MTDQEVLSSLKRDLIDKESIVSHARFETLQAKLRTLFRRPEPAPRPGRPRGRPRARAELRRIEHEHACIFADSAHHKTSDFAGRCTSARSCRGRPLFIEDLAAMPDRTPAEEELHRVGLAASSWRRSHYQDKVIGTLEPQLAAARAISTRRTCRSSQEVLPLFSMAVQRSVEELDARVQAFIKEKCTAIHPVVEWRFRKAVLKAMERTSASVADARRRRWSRSCSSDVYPLYALRRHPRLLRRSGAWPSRPTCSTQLAPRPRRAARARTTRGRCPASTSSLPHRQALAPRSSVSLNSGDEIGDHRRSCGRRSRALFDHLQTFGPRVRERIEAYRGALDPRLGTVYRRRRLFEESVTRITEAISVVPRPRGAGRPGACSRTTSRSRRPTASTTRSTSAARLLEDGALRPALPEESAPLAAHGRVRRRSAGPPAQGPAARAPRDHPPDSGPARAAVHPLPLRREALRRRRRVRHPLRDRQEAHRQGRHGRHDGAGDPAGQNRDRLLPGPEGREYREYIEYLQNLGYLTRDVEELELGELQGVQGLRALRVAVALENPGILRRVGLDSAPR